MGQPVRLFVLVAVLLLAAGSSLASEPIPEPDKIKLSGSYVWERGEKTVTDVLEVVLTPTEEGAWEIAFHFDWEGEPHVFEGTATGSLSGDLMGKVDSDDPGHPLKFEFKGSFSDGAFSGSHGYFNSAGELVDSGTLELSPAG